MTSRDLIALVHVAGFSTGVVLYAMLAVMTVRPHRAVAVDALNRIPLSAAVLGVVWNVGALVIYGFRDFGVGEPPAPLIALSFAALGFLPAVVVHSAWRPVGTSWPGRLLVGVSYAVSAVAAVMQFDTAFRGTSPSRDALLVLTVGYAVVLAGSALLQRGHPGRWRNLTMVALAAFAVSALHLSRDVPPNDSLVAALLGHHASLPLVLVILYQDYRFAFADLFLRRALSLVALVGMAVTLYAAAAAPLGRAVAARSSPIAGIGVLLAFWVATALAWPSIRDGVSRLVDRVILDRHDYGGVPDDVAGAIADAEEPDDILRRACAILGPVLGAASVQWRTDDAGPGPSPRLLAPPNASRDARSRPRVVVPTTERPGYIIEVDGLSGGRRLLSDDVALLESVATLVGRRIDGVRVSRERYRRDLREAEITQLATEAELRALRAQLNPHFLFNALTTIGYLLQAAPDRALGTLYRLTGLLRAVLRPPAGGFVTLGEELDIIDAYLGIEHERFEERLTVKMDVPQAVRALTVPPLIVQPLVENAVKHGIAPLKRGGTLTLAATLIGPPHGAGGPPPENASRTGGMLHIVITDTGNGLDARPTRRADGVGLSSVRRRLRLYYGDSASLTLTGGPGRGTRAEIVIPVTAGEPSSALSRS